MNNLEALVIVRNCAVYSPQLQTRQGKAALAVVDRKIQSLLRKKAWRDGGGATPIHMADVAFTYPLPDDPARVALRAIIENEDKKSTADGWLLSTARAALSSPNTADEPRSPFHITHHYVLANVGGQPRGPNFT